MGLFSRNFRDEIIQIKKKKTRGGVNIPWRWKILSPNLFVYIECVVSIPRMIRTRGYSVSDLGRRYSGVPARACSLYQGIYIYIYVPIAKVSRPRSKRRRKRSRESGRGGVHFSNREISRIYTKERDEIPRHGNKSLGQWPLVLLSLQPNPSP